MAAHSTDYFVPCFTCPNIVHSSRYFWGLAIDTVAVINLVLAVGLSVDYAAHIAHSFMIKTGTRDERMVQV